MPGKDKTSEHVRERFALDSARLSGIKKGLLRVLVSRPDGAWARSSGGERLLDTQEVGGSKPPVPTTEPTEIKALEESPPGPSCFSEGLVNIW